jgi:glycosyltransferase involved in cell wall biosynthesis
MSLPVISVVITTYNYGRFVEECIDSVLAQDYPSERVEVIVVDDGSTDDTAERVKRYGTRIQYLRQENGGQASALNAGFAKARGEIVSLLDADDYFLPGKLARLAELFAGDPALGMVYHPFLEFDMQTGERRTSQFPLVSGSPFENPEKFLWYAGYGTCVSFRRKFLNRLLPIPEEIRMLADGYLGSLIVFVAPIMAVPECLSAYRFHGKNSYYVDENRMSTESRKYRLRLFQTVFKAMRRWLADNGYKKRELAVRAFLACWDVYLQGQEFAIQEPGRLRFFVWTLKRNHANRLLQTRRFTYFNYLTAFLALIFGYSKAERMYQWQDRTMGMTRRVYESLSGGRSV